MTDLVFYIHGKVEENLIQQALEEYFHCQVLVYPDMSNPENYPVSLLLKYYPSSDLTFVCVTSQQGYPDYASRLKLLGHIAAYLNCLLALHLEINRNGRDCILLDKHGNFELIATKDDDEGDLHLLFEAPVFISKEEVVRFMEEDAAYLADLRSGKIKTGELDGD